MAGSAVTHVTYGKGSVVSRGGRYVAVRFDTVGEKTFVYPDAFGKYLTFDGEAEQSAVSAELDAQRAEQEKEASRLETERKQKAEQELRRLREAASVKRRVSKSKVKS